MKIFERKPWIGGITARSMEISRADILRGVFQPALLPPGPDRATLSSPWGRTGAIPQIRNPTLPKVHRCVTPRMKINFETSLLHTSRERKYLNSETMDPALPV